MKTVWLGFATAAALTLTSCGGEECTSANAKATSSVSQKNTAFDPECFKVTKGTEVTFKNDDGMAHTVTTESGQAETFDSGNLAAGASFKHTFDTVGSIKLTCTYHPSMYTTAIVE